MRTMAKKEKKEKRNKHHLTLIEVLAIITIISILVIISIPAFIINDKQKNIMEIEFVNVIQVAQNGSFIEDVNLPILR